MLNSSSTHRVNYLAISCRCADVRGVLNLESFILSHHTNVTLRNECTIMHNAYTYITIYNGGQRQ